MPKKPIVPLIPGTTITYHELIAFIDGLVDYDDIKAEYPELSYGGIALAIGVIEAVFGAEAGPEFDEKTGIYTKINLAHLKRLKV